MNSEEWAQAFYEDLVREQTCYGKRAGIWQPPLELTHPASTQLAMTDFKTTESRTRWMGPYSQAKNRINKSDHPWVSETQDNFRGVEARIPAKRPLLPDLETLRQAFFNSAVVWDEEFKRKIVQAEEIPYDVHRYIKENQENTVPLNPVSATGLRTHRPAQSTKKQLQSKNVSKPLHVSTQPISPRNTDYPLLNCSADVKDLSETETQKTARASEAALPSRPSSAAVTKNPKILKAQSAKRPVFFNYGRGNISPINGGMVYGGYLRSFNISPQTYPNRPMKSQVFASTQIAAFAREKRHAKASPEKKVFNNQIQKNDVTVKRDKENPLKTSAQSIRTDIPPKRSSSHAQKSAKG